ncbi:MAG TPA: protein kinase [Gemmatimonadaceae bacterium]|nr:protein kinase [Gemmatimonadaceae bacterium]
MSADVERRATALLRHRVRGVAHRIVSECEVLLSDTAPPEWRVWRDAVGEAMVAAHQLRSIVDRAFGPAGGVLARDEIAALNTQMREPQHRIVQAMTRVLGLVPTDLDDELLLDDARTIRDLALRIGSDDTLKLPAAHDSGPRDRPQRLTPSVSRTVASRGPARLLVVDDSEGPRKVLVRLLERMGYEVVAAADGLEGMAIAERERIDVIVSDIEMPNCNGFEFLERLKASGITHDIPVIVVSGVDDNKSVVRCIELGAEDHLTKPFDSMLLQARVRTSLERRRSRDHELDYLRRVAELTVAAEEVEKATYMPGSVSHLANEDDPLGRLARVFDRVVSGWQSKEARLRRQIREFSEEIRRSNPRPSVELELLGGLGALGAGDVFADRYEIIEELGRGGMGVVYRARDRELDDEIAVKVLRAELLKTDPELIERLKMEIRLARRITHPNVVRSHDFGEWEGKHFMTMEYVKAITVESLIEMQGRLSVASTLAIGTQLAEALAVAHEHHIIHRDIKPANLLVGESGVLKVTDFGLAIRLDKRSDRLTLHGAVVGTPRYMPPEQLFGGEVDERSDLFSTGAVMYECLTGLSPFDADTVTEIVAKLVDGPPVPIASVAPEVSPALASLIEKLLAYEPKDRLQSARELIDRLHEVG